MQLLGIIVSVWTVLFTFLLLVWWRLLEHERDKQEERPKQEEGVEDDWELWTEELILN